MPELTHDQAVDALMKIRRAQALAETAVAVAINAKSEFGIAKEIAKKAEANARDVTRGLTRELPLFDARDGLVPSAAPDGWRPLSDLTIPDEVKDSLQDFGFASVATLLVFRTAGIDWRNVPGIDSAGARKLEEAIARYLASEPEPKGDSGDFSAQILDQVAAEINAGAMGPDVTATVTKRSRRKLEKAEARA